MIRKAATALCALCFAATATPALAREGDGKIVSIGAGLRFSPKYPGADELGLGPLPFFDIRDAGDPLTFESPDEGAGFGLLSDDSAFNIGPAVNFQGKRDEDDVGANVGNVGFTVEAGAFAEYYVMPNLRLRAEGRRGIGGHDAFVGDITADFIIRDRDTYVFSIGPRARWGEGKYQRAYFGVDPATAAATGLAPYRPGGGFHAAGVAAGLTYMIGSNWGLHGFAGYDRLIGDAADSPIVRTFGSRNQFSAGAGLFYSFGVGRRSGG